MGLRAGLREESVRGVRVVGDECTGAWGPGSIISSGWQPQEFRCSKLESNRGVRGTVGRAEIARIILESGVIIQVFVGQGLN